jgi:hypothetical protein
MTRRRAHTDTATCSRHTHPYSKGAASEGAGYSEASAHCSTSRPFRVLAPEGARYTQHALFPPPPPLSLFPSGPLRLTSLFQLRWHGTPGAYRRLLRRARVCAVCNQALVACSDARPCVRVLWTRRHPTARAYIQHLLICYSYTREREQEKVGGKGREVGGREGDTVRDGRTYRVREFYMYRGDFRILVVSY